MRPQYRQFNMLLPDDRSVTVIIPLYMKQSEYDYMLKVIDMQKDVIANAQEHEPEQEEMKDEGE